MDGYLTTAEAAAMLGLAERTIYYYLRDSEKTGFPEPRRFGRALMWDEQALLAWRESHPARTPHPEDTSSRHVKESRSGGQRSSPEREEGDGFDERQRCE